MTDTSTKIFHGLKTLFEGTEYYEQSSPAFAHLQEVVNYAQRFDIKSKIFVCPLGTWKERFCKDGLVFACVGDRKSREIFAAGGRYDSLVREQSLLVGKHTEAAHAVGFNLAWEKLAWAPTKAGKEFLKKQDEDTQGEWNAKRVSCESLRHVLNKADKV